MGWIKVPQRIFGEFKETEVSFMPKHNQEIIFITQTGKKKIGYYDNYGCGIFKSHSEITKFLSHDVSHWLPIPELSEGY